MFSTLKQGSLIFVLTKGDKPELKIGTVESVKSTPKYPTYNPSMPLNMQQEQELEISVKADGNALTFEKVPSNLEIFNYPNAVISDKREVILAEVEGMIQTSRQVLNSVDYHQSVLDNCDEILKVLNPQFAKEKQQEEKIVSLETEVKSMKNALTDIKSLLMELNGSSKSKTTSKN
jgi:hypothetical protein